MGSAVPLVRLAVATGRAAARVATVAVAAGRAATLARAAGAVADTVPRVRPGGRAGQPTGQEQLEDLGGWAMFRAVSPGGRPLAADQAAGLAGRMIVRARATGPARLTGRARPVSLAGPVRQAGVPGPGALMVPPRPVSRAGPMARLQVSGPAGPTLRVRAAGPGGRARTRTDCGASRMQARARLAGRVAPTAQSVGPRDGGTKAPVAQDPAAAGPRARMTRGSVGDRDVPTSGRARHEVTRAEAAGVLGLPNADRAGRAGSGPAMTRAGTTSAGTGRAGPPPGLGRAGTTSPGTRRAGLPPGLARAGGRCPDRRQADGTRSGLPPDPVATGRTVAGQPDLAGHQERAPAVGRDSMRLPPRQPGRIRPVSACRRCRTASRLINSMLTHVLNSGRFPPISPTRWRAS